MFYPNYYPYHMNTSYRNNNYYSNYVQPQGDEKKDTVSENTDTIPFKPIENTKKPNVEKGNKFNILGFSFEIDDLIIVGIIILLFLESDKNYALIIILGLILLNVNLSDILNIF